MTLSNIVPCRKKKLGSWQDPGTIPGRNENPGAIMLTGITARLLVGRKIPSGQNLGRILPGILKSCQDLWRESKLLVVILPRFAGKEKFLATKILMTFMARIFGLPRISFLGKIHNRNFGKIHGWNDTA